MCESPAGRFWSSTRDAKQASQQAFSGTSPLSLPPPSTPRSHCVRYLDRWSDLRTWLHNEPPVEDDLVVIPDGQTVVLDVSPPRLFVLLVQGVLTFGRQDLNLDANYILIQGGQFEVGTPSEPFLQVGEGIDVTG